MEKITFHLLQYNYSTYLYNNTLILLMFNFSLLKYNYFTSSKDNHPVDVYFSKGNKSYIGSWGFNIFYSNHILKNFKLITKMHLRLKTADHTIYSSHQST